MSKNRTTLFTGTIQQITRTTSSTNGNPAFLVRMEGTGVGTEYVPGPQFRTQTDSSVGYEIENYSPRRHPEPVQLTLTPAGRIIGIRSLANAAAQ
jgi:hypothetical protein